MATELCSEMWKYFTSAILDRENECLVAANLRPDKQWIGGRNRVVWPSIVGALG